MTTILFLAFVALMTAIVVALISRYRNTRAAVGVLAGIVLWFAYACLMAYFGVIRNAAIRPPGITFIVVP
jgi:uncharacterized BrkB/YihY/UPF0761 family membrane protein